MQSRLWSNRLRNKVFYDLGNDFYATDFGAVYYLKNGISVDDIKPDIDYDNYFVYISSIRTKKVFFLSPEGEELSAVSLLPYYESDSIYYGWFNDSYCKLVLSNDGEIYTYQLIDYYNYSPTAFYAFISATVATVLTCTAIQLIKRKKQNYNF